MTEEKNMILFSQSQIYMVFVPYNKVRCQADPENPE